MIVRAFHANEDAEMNHKTEIEIPGSCCFSNGISNIHCHMKEASFDNKQTLEVRACINNETCSSTLRNVLC